MLDIVDSITNILDVKNGSVFFMVFHNVFNVSKIKRDRLVYIIYLLIKLILLILNNIVIFCV